MRTFKFKLTTQIPLETLQSNAVTFGELKHDIENSSLGQKISFTRKSEVRDGNTWVKTIKLIEKTNLWEFGDIDEASLPSGDNLIFFVTPVEHKGGLLYSPEELHEKENFDVVEDVISEWGYNDLMKLGSQINKNYDADIDLSGKRSNILDNILEYFENYYIMLPIDSESTDEKFKFVKDCLTTAINYISDAIDILEGYNIEEIVGGTTLSELHSKAIELQSRLNKI